jgi:hypothetical protein
VLAFRTVTYCTENEETPAWSIRFSLLAAAFTAAEVVVPLFGDVLPRGAFVLLAFSASIGATVARIVAQPEMHR